MADSATQRRNMIESQVRPSDVTDRRIMAAMAAIPRERFVPDALAGLAYSDELLSVTPGAAMVSPRVLAKLMQLAEIKATDNALVLGGAPGYAAALTGEIAAHVIALQPNQADADRLAKLLAELHCVKVSTAAGSLAQGWSQDAPFDVIIIEGGIERVPEALETQLAEGGRLVGIEVGHGMGTAVQMQRWKGVLAKRDGFQTSAPLIEGFAAARPAFVF